MFKELKDMLIKTLTDDEKQELIDCLSDDILENKLREHGHNSITLSQIRYDSLSQEEKNNKNNVYVIDENS